MNHRPQVTLVRVLEALDTTLLTIVCGTVARERTIEAIVIHDPRDEPDAPRNSLVMGVGVEDPALVRRLLPLLAQAGVTALVVRAPFSADDALRAEAEATGVVVLALNPSTTWAHLAGMLRSLMTPGDPDDARPVTFGGILAGDLFAVADAIAALLESPVTIEDRNAQLLAFSNGPESQRAPGIGARPLPSQDVRALEENGTLAQIARSEWPVEVATGSAGDEVRTAIAVRAGDEVLGTIWTAGSLTAERSSSLHDAAKLVAMHLVWQRTDADVERRLRAELLRTALGGGPSAGEAVHRLGLREEACVVLALTLHDPAAEQLPHAHLAAERKRVADAFAVHLSFAHPRSVSGLVGDVAYGVLPLASAGDADDEGDSAVRVATEFLTRMRSALRPLIGVGMVVAETALLPRSRASADRALRVLRAGIVDRQVARLDEVHAEALLLELSGPARDIPSGPLARLLAYDETHGSSLTETLEAWLDAFGDVGVAAAAKFVHPNTFRYRLRRVAEVGRIDLDDPNARFGAMMQLRLRAISPER
ncbi:PucR family transcriptional regulator [Microbacterium sp. NPDC089698]|jgi:hypothetical protein|uniref:PucR family transcriptional regulator n=1 Tax=unclassified Microbacterium TaxID=2609290 RepID=UPI0028184E34|nr:helix-turn-helix domain-containing protein [Microbacterium sp.]MDR2323102.1 helix-turn-helix domain-containing protein [Microbacterium sp.]